MAVGALESSHLNATVDYDNNRKEDLLHSNEENGMFPLYRHK